MDDVEQIKTILRDDFIKEVMASRLNEIKDSGPQEMVIESALSGLTSDLRVSSETVTTALIVLMVEKQQQIYKDKADRQNQETAAKRNARVK